MCVCICVCVMHPEYVYLIRSIEEGSHPILTIELLGSDESGKWLLDLMVRKDFKVYPITTEIKSRENVR